jgi:Family of unknown function (DUF6088)
LTTQERLLLSIQQQTGNVILRADVAQLGSATQVTRALKALQAMGVLMRIGTGVYAKTRTSSVTGATIPAGSLETLVTEALKKLGVSASEGSAAAAYNAGSTTQLPGKFVVNTGRRRISRKIEVGGRSVVYENDFNRTQAGES